MPRGNPDPDGEDRRVLSRAARPPDGTWAYGPDPDQVADVYVPGADPVPSTVVLIHGGFWRPEYDRAHLRPLAAHLAGRGHLVVSLEYRRRPGSPDETVSDLRRAVAAVAAEPEFNAHHLQAVGHSAGGHLVLLLAADADTPLQSALALAPVADLQRAEALTLDGDAVPAFLGTAAVSRSDLDPARRQPPAIPTAILHGRDDSIVPIEVSASFLDALPDGTRPVLRTVPATGHFELIDPQSPAIHDVDDALDALAGSTDGIG